MAEFKRLVTIMEEMNTKTEANQDEMEALREAVWAVREDTRAGQEVTK
jgi:outer membrane murein-binding lipoprotein Lpp